MACDALLMKLVGVMWELFVWLSECILSVGAIGKKSIHG